MARASPVCPRGANDNRRRGRDLTIDELLAEPMVQDLMRADRVDPAAFEALLRSIVPRQARQPRG